MELVLGLKTPVLFGLAAILPLLACIAAIIADKVDSWVGLAVCAVAILGTGFFVFLVDYDLVQIHGGLSEDGGMGFFLQGVVYAGCCIAWAHAAIENMD